MPPIISAYGRAEFMKGVGGRTWTTLTYPTIAWGGGASGPPSTRTVWLGNHFYMLGSDGTQYAYLRVTNPDTWGSLSWTNLSMPAGIANGYVGGLAVNDLGILMAVLNLRVALSRDRGASWLDIGALPFVGVEQQVGLVALGPAFVLVNNPTTATPTHYISYDGGATWK